MPLGTDTEYVHDLVFDPEDVDLSDLIDLTIPCMGQVCPQIVDTPCAPLERGGDA